MLGPSRSYRLPALLLILCLGVAGLIVLQLFQPPDNGSAKPAAPQSMSKDLSMLTLQGDDLLLLPERALVDAILARPLFAPTRRPETEVVQVPVAREPSPGPAPRPQMPTLSAVLLGTVVGQSERFALVASTVGGEGKALAEGDEFAGWTLIFITAGEVIFQRDDERRVIKLKYREAQ